MTYDEPGPVCRCCGHSDSRFVPSCRECGHCPECCECPELPSEETINDILFYDSMVEGGCYGGFGDHEAPDAYVNPVPPTRSNA